MTSIAVTKAAPVRGQAVSDGLDDVVAEATTVFDAVRDLARLGVEVAVMVRTGEVLADVVVHPAAAHLMPAIIKELEHSGIARMPGGYRVAGTMQRGTVKIRVIVVDSSQVADSVIRDLVAAADVDFDAERAA